MTQLNYVALRNKCDVIILLFPPRVRKRKGFVAQKMRGFTKSPRAEYNSATTDVFQRKPVALKYLCYVKCFCDGKLTQGERRVASNRSACQVEIQDDYSARKFSLSNMSTE